MARWAAPRIAWCNVAPSERRQPRREITPLIGRPRTGSLDDTPPKLASEFASSVAVPWCDHPNQPRHWPQALIGLSDSPDREPDALEKQPAAKSGCLKTDSTKLPRLATLIALTPAHPQRSGRCIGNRVERCTRQKESSFRARREFSHGRSPAIIWPFATRKPKAMSKQLPAKSSHSCPTSSDQLEKYSEFMFFPPPLQRDSAGSMPRLQAKRSQAWIPKHPTSQVLTPVALGCENCGPRPHFFRRMAMNRPFGHVRHSRSALAADRVIVLAAPSCEAFSARRS